MDVLFAGLLAGAAPAGSPGPAPLSLAVAGAGFGGACGTAYPAGGVVGRPLASVAGTVLV